MMVSNLGTTNKAATPPPIAQSTTISPIMTNEILFYDLTAQSSVRPNKCFALNTLYDHPSSIKTRS